MESFSIKTLQALIDMETQRQTEPLSLGSLVRMDIGVVKRPNGEMDYYVNEVSRPPCCSLMVNLEPDTGQLEIMARSVREGLVKMYLHHCNKFPALSRRNQ
jgi:hypothetical protein